MSEAADINAVIESIVQSISELKQENERLRSASIDGASLKSMQLSLEKKDHELKLLKDRVDELEKECLKLKQENEHYLAKINQLATLVAKESSSKGAFVGGKTPPSVMTPKTEDLKVASPRVDGNPSPSLQGSPLAASSPQIPPTPTPSPAKTNPFDGQDSDDPFIEGGDMDDDEFFKSIQR